MIAEHVAVICEKDDEGFFEKFALLQDFENAADLLVYVADRSVVSLA